jgi:hypothetical protein
MGFFIIRRVLPDALSSFFDSLQYLTESNRSHMIHGKSGIQSQISKEIKTALAKLRYISYNTNGN